MANVMDLIKKGIDEEAKKEEAAQKEIITNLGSDDTPSLDTIRDALTHIQEQFQKDDIPYNTIEVGLRSVMQILKSHEDLALELQPQDISEIVQSYMALSDEEVRTIFDKSAKKKKTKTKTYGQKKALKAVEEADEEGSDDDELIL